MIHTQNKVNQLLKYLAVGALTFQVVHLIEHVAQLTYWGFNPSEAPWLTPWAVEARDALAVSGHVSLGTELLHLLGNLVFLGGLIAMVQYNSRTRVARLPGLRVAVWVQSLHVLEHLALTMTTGIVGRAIGVSTFLGLGSGPVVTSFRVWFHFLVNLAATWFAVQALAALYRRGALSGSDAVVGADHIGNESKDRSARQRQLGTPPA